MSVELEIITLSLDAEGSIIEPRREGRKDCYRCKGSGRCRDCSGDGIVECECEHGHSMDHDCDECGGSGECKCVGVRSEPSGVVYAITLKGFPERIAFESMGCAMAALATLKEMAEDRVLRLWTLGVAA